MKLFHEFIMINFIQKNVDVKSVNIANFPLDFTDFDIIYLSFQ